MPNDLTYWKIVAATQSATLLLIVVFLARPQIDVEVSALFFNERLGFVHATSPAALILRDAFRFFFDAASILVVALLAQAALAPGRVLVPARHWGFVAAVLAIGPWLAANELFKDNWGRARPADIEAFGGPDLFTAPFLMSDACPRNCSFVSGEASAMAALALALGALLWNSLPPRDRVWMIIGFGAPVCIASVLRLAMGRHFLSDIVFAWLLCALVVATLYPLFRLGASRARFTPRNITSDLTALARLVHSGLASLLLRLRRLLRA